MFMVEMQETAHILSGATSKSLVVDESWPGQVTSTASASRGPAGVSHHPAVTAEDAVCDALPRAHGSCRMRSAVVNFHVAAYERKDDIIFCTRPAGRLIVLRHPVARLAGLPAR
jgi:hypothetical protein